MRFIRPTPPAETDAGINLAAPVISRKQTLVFAPRVLVWRTLTDFAHWPEWVPEVSRADLNEPLTPGACVRWKAAGLSTTAVITTVIPLERIGWMEESRSIRAIQVWDLHTVDRGVLVCVEESWDGDVVHAHSALFKSGLDACLVDWLDRLKRRVESGVSSGS